MKPYTLALGLALGEARAEDCIDGLVISIESQGTNNHVAQLLQNPEIQKQVADKIKRVYEKELGIPTRITFGQRTDETDITVIYTSKDFLREKVFPTYDTLNAYISRNLNPTLRTVYLDSNENLGKLSASEQQWVKERLYYNLTSAWESLDGFSDLPERTSYIFSRPIEDPSVLLRWNNEADVQTFAYNANHEISHHLLGPGHSEKSLLEDGNRDLRYHITPSGYIGNLILMEDGYTFSSEDKAKIRSQLCKPEEIK